MRVEIHAWDFLCVHDLYKEKILSLSLIQTHIYTHCTNGSLRLESSESITLIIELSDETILEMKSISENISKPERTLSLRIMNDTASMTLNCWNYFD